MKDVPQDVKKQPSVFGRSQVILAGRLFHKGTQADCKVPARYQILFLVIIWKAILNGEKNISFLDQNTPLTLLGLRLKAITSKVPSDGMLLLFSQP